MDPKRTPQAKRRRVNDIITKRTEIQELIGGLHSWRNIAAQLHPRDVLKLSQICRSLHAVLLPIIETFYFSTTFKPKRINLIGHQLSIINHYFVAVCNSLSETLTHLNTGEYFDSPINNLPKTLTHLTLGENFDQELDHLPKGLLHLTLGGCFNQPINHLPPSLTHLIFSDCGPDALFNQSLDNLPSNLTHLTTGGAFNKSIHCLPSTLTHLMLGALFDQPMDKLPPKLFKLKFIYSEDCNQPITFPKTLTQLTLGEGFNHPLHGLPPSVTTHLKVGRKFTHFSSIPPTVLRLSFAFGFNSTIKNLPSTLTRIKFGESFDKSLDNLPHSITHITFCEESDFDQPVNTLPPNLTHLIFGTRFKQPLLKLPSSLTFLVIAITHAKRIKLDNIQAVRVRFRLSSKNNSDIFECGSNALNGFGFKFGDKVDKTPYGQATVVGLLDGTLWFRTFSTLKTWKGCESREGINQLGIVLLPEEPPSDEEDDDDEDSSDDERAIGPWTPWYWY